MATYGKEFRYNPPRRRKQRYALVERVVDFSNAPVTSGIPDQPNSANVTTAWAASDVLQAIQIRAGQTVLGVNVEIMTLSGTANAWVKVGYGTDDDYWGLYNIGTAQSGNVGTPSTGWKTDDSDDDGAVLNFGKPLYFSSADTIDLVINKAITAGRIRVVVHLLEDDR